MSLKSNEITVVIPNWNGKADIGNSLRSLQDQKTPCRVVVVENGSTDGSAEYIRHYFPNVEIIELEKNYGFAAGVNFGIKKALKLGSRYVALFNNDAVADREWLFRLVKRMETSPSIGIVTGKFMQYKDREKIDSTGEEYSIWGLAFPRGRDELDKGQFNISEEVFGASGGASLYRSKLFKEVGLFDERFFAYYEDIDLSFRARLKGWLIYYEPSARAYHKIGATSSRLGQFTRYHQIKNSYFLYIKNMPASLFWRYFPRYTVSLLSMISYNIRNRLFSSLLKAHLVVLIRLPGILMERFKIQKNRRVENSYIDDLFYRGIPPAQRTLVRIATMAGKCRLR